MDRASCSCSIHFISGVVSVFAWNTRFPLSQMHLCYRRSITQLDMASSLPKTTFMAKINGELGWDINKQIRDPLYLLVAATIATSNCVYNLGLGCSLSRKNFWDQNWCGVSARGASKNIWNPYLFLQPLKLATSNLVHNMNSNSPCQKKNFWDQNRWVWNRGVPPKCGTPLSFIHPFIHS